MIRALEMIFGRFIGEILSGTLSCKFDMMMMNLKIHERTTYCHTITEYKVYNKFLLYLYQDGLQKEREIVWINTGANKSKEEDGGFMDINQRKLELLPLNLNRCTRKMARNQTYP